jgi:hypothetical protein
MKKAVILSSVFVLFALIAGCKSGPQDGQDAAAPAASEAAPQSELIPFGLTLKWRVEDIPLSDKWATKYSPEEKKYFPNKGILVKEVLERSQAKSAGFLGNDIIFLVNGKDFGNTSKFVRLMSGATPGKPIEIRVVRKNAKGENEFVDLTLKIPTDNISSYNMLLFGHYRNDYQSSSYFAFLVLWYDRSSASSHTWGIWPLYVPFYHRERVGNVITQRILWFINWRLGPEDEITF